VDSALHLFNFSVFSNVIFYFIISSRQFFIKKPSLSPTGTDAVDTTSKTTILLPFFHIKLSDLHQEIDLLTDLMF